jgi:uncharacterized metal-binding protein YceD (DUF177 family)
MGFQVDSCSRLHHAPNSGQVLYYYPVKVSVEELRARPSQRLIISYKEELEGTEAAKPVIGELSLALDQTGVRISGRVQTLLKLHCHRCLHAYFQGLTIDIDERLVFEVNQEQPRDRELLLQRDFVEPIPKSGVLDITDIVYQAVTLATPSYCLCGSQCPGPPTAQTTGPDQPLDEPKEQGGRIDPRWKNLKTLFPNKESDGKS